MYVYVVKGRDAVKVGVSKNPNTRLYELGSSRPNDERYAFLYSHQANLIGRRIVFMVPVPNREFAHRVERYAHWLMRRANIHGEWFWIEPEMACRCVLMALRGVEQGRTKPPSTVVVGWYGERERKPKRVDAIPRVWAA